MLQPEATRPLAVNPETVVARANHMTARARWYLGIAATRHLSVGGLALLMPGSFTSAAFIPILSAAPLLFWGSFFMAAGLSCALAAGFRSEALARLGMALSATSTLLVGVGLVLAILNGLLVSPIGPILWIAVALKDFVVCAQPIRSPFEGLAEQVAHGPERSVQ